MKLHSGNLMRTRMNRRRFALATTASVVMGLPPARTIVASQHVHTQEGSPGEADVTWTWIDAGAEVTPEIAAGWNRMSIANNRSAGSPQTYLLTFRVPEGVTDQQIEDELMADDAPFPDWAREAYYPGIPTVSLPGRRSTGTPTTLKADASGSISLPGLPASSWSVP